MSAPGGLLPPAYESNRPPALATSPASKRWRSAPFGTYVRTPVASLPFLWDSWTSADAASRTPRLAFIWTLLNPLLLVVSYFLIFGLLLDTKRGVAEPHRLPVRRRGRLRLRRTDAITKGTKRSIVGLVGWSGPAPCSPSVTLSEAIHRPGDGRSHRADARHPRAGGRLKWLPACRSLSPQIAMMASLVLMGARLFNISRDIGNLIPVAIRLLRYLRGLQHRPLRAPP